MFSNIITFNISASAIAWYGAIVATFGFILSLYIVRRDRVSVKVRVRRNVRALNSAPDYDPKKIYFNITAVNIGRRAVRIEKAAIRLIPKGYYLFSDSFRVTRHSVLTEENPRTEFLVDQTEIDFSKAWYVAVYDASRREYRKYLHRFPTFWRILNFYKK